MAGMEAGAMSSSHLPSRLMLGFLETGRTGQRPCWICILPGSHLGHVDEELETGCRENKES